MQIIIYNKNKKKIMKTIKIKIENNKGFEIKVGDDDLETLLKIIEAFSR